jgi:twitching motility two-component system response regulator PilH
LRPAVASVDARVITASSGTEAVEKAKAEKPDIIFMDIVMDDLDGYGACREIKRNDDTSDIPATYPSYLYRPNINVQTGRGPTSKAPQR